MVQDDDGRWMLDFTGDAIKAVSGADLGEELVRPACDFVKREHERFVSERNEKLAPRYERLRRYMESRLPLW